MRKDIFLTALAVCLAACLRATTVSAPLTADPDITISGNLQICPGDTTVLTADGGENYLWSNGETTASILVSPSSTTDYAVTVSDGAGGTASASATVAVYPGAAVSIGNGQLICTGQYTALNATGSGNFVWNTGETTASILTGPSFSTTYAVTLTTPDGCTATDSATVTVLPYPIADAGPDQRICRGQSALLTASGGSVYFWGNGLGLGPTHTVTPSISTTYSVTMSNGAGCTASDAVTVTVGNYPLASAGPDQTICAGETATLTASGSGEYLWTTGETTASIDINPSATTNYGVTVSGPTGCTASDLALVNVAPAAHANAGIDQTACAGQTAHLLATGNGTFLWSTGETTAQISATPSLTTTYGLTVTSADGCTATDDVTVTVAPPLSATLSQTAPACGQTSSGALAASVANGSGSYSYEWDAAANAGNSAFAAGLSPGDFSITISDLASGCTASATAAVGAVPAIFATLLPTATTCGQANGALVCNVSDGSNFYSYEWSANAADENSALAAGLAPGGFSVTATDNASGCTASATATVAASEALEISLSATPATCGQANGTLMATVANGSGSYTYEWSGGQAAGNSNFAPGLAPGDFSVQISDLADGCTASATATVPADFSFPVFEADELDLKNIACFGGLTGSIAHFGNLNLTVKNASGASIGQTPLAGLPAGVYTVEKTGANGCATVLNVQLDGPTAALSASAQIQNPNCCGENGGLTLVPGGGWGGFSVAWPAGVLASGGSADGLPMGNYAVTVSDSGGCTLAVSAVLAADCGPCAAGIFAADSLLETESAAPLAVCLPPANFPLAQLEISIDGQPYAGGLAACGGNSGTAIFVVGTPGTHLLTFENRATCCRDTLVLTIKPGTPPPPPTDCPGLLAADSLSIAAPACGQAAEICLGLPLDSILTHKIRLDGAVYADVFLGCDFDSAFAYLFSTIPNQGQIGPYRLDGWRVNADVFSGQFADIQGLLDSMNHWDPLGNWKIHPGSMTLRGGAQANVYGSLHVLQTQTGGIAILAPTLTLLPQGTGIRALPGGHLVTVTNTASGCADTLHLTVTCPPPCAPGFLEADKIDLAPAPCAGYESWVCVDVPFAQIADYQVFENGGAHAGDVAACNFNGTGAATGTALRLGRGGDFEFIFQDKTGGCTDTVRVSAPCFSLTTDTLRTTVHQFQKDTFCLESTELPGLPASVENACLSTGQFASFERTAGSLCYVCTGVEVGEERVCFVVCDDSGICDTTYLFVTVVPRAQQPPVAETDLDSTFVGAPLRLAVLKNDTTTGETESLRILAPPGHGNAEIQSGNIILYTPEGGYCDEETPDNFQYEICNAGGCDTALVFVWVLCAETIVYDAISPNGDGQNDTFTILGLDRFAGHKLRIFSRWGALVFEKTGYENDWDGTWNGGEPLPDGVYFWVLDLADGGRGKSGFVVLRR